MRSVGVVVKSIIKPYGQPVAEFLLSAPNIDGCPDLGGQPEIAMVGRSNVGKSSLINSLIRRKRLAHTSNTPGKTRLINYYWVDSTWALVDLPGYGFAQVSKTEQERWRQSLEQYLRQRSTLLGVLQLIDARHGPQANDRQMNEWLSACGVEVGIVVTKMDKAKRSQRDKVIAATRKDLRFNRGLYSFSSETREGAEALWWGLEAWRDEAASRVP